jgi:hypothetical protein
MVLPVHPIPGHEQVETEVFQGRDGRTAVLKERSAWVSPARSPLMRGERKEKREIITRYERARDAINGRRAKVISWRGKEEPRGERESRVCELAKWRSPSIKEGTDE